MSHSWEDKVYALVHEVARSKKLFTMDDIWNLVNRDGLSIPKEPRVLGAIMVRAKDNGVCALTDDFRNSSMIHRNHSRPMRVWKSMIFGGSPPPSLPKAGDFFV